MPDYLQKRYGDIFYSVSEAENFAGKAYTYRPNESVKMWLRRGAREDGENRVKFRKTIFSQARMTMRKYENDGQIDLLRFPDPNKLAIAFKSVKARAVELTKEAKLDDHTSEMVLEAIQAAHETLTIGPNMANLTAYRLLVLIENGMSIADASSEATRWAQDEIVKAKVAADNPLGDDDEAIAAALLAKIRADEAGPDAFGFSIDT
jgi:hypothetical protein